MSHNTISFQGDWTLAQDNNQAMRDYNGVQDRTLHTGDCSGSHNSIQTLYGRLQRAKDSILGGSPAERSDDRRRRPVSSPISDGRRPPVRRRRRRSHTLRRFCRSAVITAPVRLRSQG